MKRIFYSFLSAVLLAGLTACGGSSSSTAGVSGTISGTAATGLPIVGATVKLKCADGSSITGAQPTGTDGKFSITVTNVVLPCMAELDDGAGTVLHSYVGALGTTNISPITEMVMGSLLGNTPTAAFSAFDASKISGVSDAKVQAAIAAVKTKLQGLGVDTTNLGDPIKDALTAGSHTGMDAVLDDFKTRRGVKTIDTLTGELADSSPNKGGTNGGGGVTGGGTGGYPVAGTYTGKTSDNAACTITVGADHSVTASAGGQSLATTLDGFVNDAPSGEIYLLVFYNAASKFYESTGSNADYGAATTGNPYQNIGLSFDSSTGKFIMAQGQKVTDPSNSPAAGKNFNFVCAGEAYPSGTPIGTSGFNAATPSRFKATTLVGGPYTAPAANAACSFAVDSTGNSTITWAGFTTTGGKLVLPADRLTTDTDQTVIQAKYEVYYNKTTGALVGSNSNGQTILSAGDSTASDWFSVTLSKDTAGNKAATVMANGLLSNNKSVSCSTANDPAAKWNKVAAYAGTWIGVRNTNNAFGSATTCKLVVATDGSMVYTDTSNASTSIDSTGWTVTPPSATNSAFFDFAKNGTAVTFDMDFSGTSIVSGPSVGKPGSFYWKSGASSEYCDKMVKQ